MNRAIVARLHQLEAALRHQRAARQQREQAAKLGLPSDPAELRRLYDELTAPSDEPVPELVGLNPVEMVDAYRRLLAEGEARWRR